MPSFAVTVPFYHVLHEEFEKPSLIITDAVEGEAERVAI